MDANQLLTASALDIIFDGRNKEYGAYCLRKYYNKRLSIALIFTGIIVTAFILLITPYKSSSDGSLIACTFPLPDTELTPIEPDEEPPQIINPPKSVTPPPPAFASIKFTTPPLIVNDKDVSPDDVPPSIDDALNAKIDLVTKDGLIGGPDFTPPKGTGTGVIGSLAGLKKDDDSIFRKVEIESTYPGGPQAWARFLNKNFRYPQDAADNGVQGTVKVEFVVDINGDLSNITVISGPKELIGEAIRVIKKSGKWNPAIQNGRTVKSYKQQPISFTLVSE